MGDSSNALMGVVTVAPQASTWKTPLGSRSWLTWTVGPYGLVWDVIGQAEWGQPEYGISSG